MPDATILAAISAIASMVSAVVACITIYRAKIILEEERDSKRPYITIKEPGIKLLPNSPPFRIQIMMLNVGHNPANNLEGKILFTDKQLENHNLIIIEFSVSNEVPSNIPTPYYNDTLTLPDNVNPMNIILAIKYSDPISKKSFRQIFTMKWDGVVNKQFHPDFVHTTLNEKTEIIRKSRKLLHSYL